MDSRYTFDYFKKEYLQFREMLTTKETFKWDILENAFKGLTYLYLHTEQHDQLLPLYKAAIREYEMRTKYLPIESEQ